MPLQIPMVALLVFLIALLFVVLHLISRVKALEQAGGAAGFTGGMPFGTAAVHQPPVINNVVVGGTPAGH
ncbi:MAG: hypothetical protein HYS44_01925 [Candidatus Niyogibacteria bacterium]|nr:hypothetical protein [Candidatus Niyogibacteria bacterium]